MYYGTYIENSFTNLVLLLRNFGIGEGTKMHVAQNFYTEICG
jgi:hypothetical protein